MRTFLSRLTPSGDRRSAFMIVAVLAMVALAWSSFRPVEEETVFRATPTSPVPLPPPPTPVAKPPVMAAPMLDENRPLTNEELRELTRRAVSELDELEARKRIDWQLETACDFESTELPAGFEARVCADQNLMRRNPAIIPPPKPGFFIAGGGQLQMHGSFSKWGPFYLTVLRWTRPLGPDVRIVGDVLADGGPGASFSVAGDSFVGYRIILNLRKRTVELDSIAGGKHVIFTAAALPRIPRGSIVRVSITRVGRLIRVFLNKLGQESPIGKLVWYERDPRTGLKHELFGVSIYAGHATVKGLKAYRGVGGPDEKSALRSSRSLQEKPLAPAEPLELF